MYARAFVDTVIDLQLSLWVQTVHYFSAIKDTAISWQSAIKTCLTFKLAWETSVQNALEEIKTTKQNEKKMSGCARRGNGLVIAAARVKASGEEVEVS